MSGQGSKELEISYRQHQPVSLIYIDSQGTISQRVVQVTELAENRVQAYCYTRREPRTFLREQILAVSLKVPRYSQTRLRSVRG